MVQSPKPVEEKQTKDATPVDDSINLGSVVEATVGTVADGIENASENAKKSKHRGSKPDASKVASARSKKKKAQRKARKIQRKNKK